MQLPYRHCQCLFFFGSRCGILLGMAEHITHPFDDAVNLTGGPDTWQGHTAAAYANMVGPFGGITAAVMLQPLLQHPQRLGEPITLTVNFAAAVQDGAFAIKTQMMRTNRSTQHWFVTLEQGGEVAATATAVFAVRRESWGTTEMPFPGMPQDAELMASGLLPPWTRNYRFEMTGGMDAVFSAEHPTSITHQTIRDNPPRPLDFLSLAAMSDVFFPRIFARLGTFVPAGTVAFTVYFHADAAALTAIGDAAVIGNARGNRFHNRYFDQSAEIWSSSGDLLATSTQIVYYKA